jgi:hypothetical protein
MRLANSFGMGQQSRCRLQQRLPGVRLNHW